MITRAYATGDPWVKKTAGFPATITAGTSVVIPVPDGGFSHVIGKYRPATDDETFIVEFSDDGGSTWKQGAADYRWSTDGANDDGTASVNGSVGRANILMAGSLTANLSVGNAVNEGCRLNFIFWQRGATDSIFAGLQGECSWMDASATSRYRHRQFSGVYQTVALITHIRIRALSGGNFSGRTYVGQLNSSGD